MNHRVFEMAAIEARAGITEIEAEIDRLKARRELLEVLESVVHQVLTVVPMTTDPIPAGRGNDAGAPPETPAREQPSFVDRSPERRSDSLQNVDWPPDNAAAAAPEAPATEQPSLADLISQDKPHSLRDERWPTGSPIDPRRIRELL